MTGFRGHEVGLGEELGLDSSIHSEDTYFSASLCQALNQVKGVKGCP